MPLDIHGKLAAGELVVLLFLVGLLLTSLFLDNRRTGKFETGWIYFSVYALVHIIGSSLTVYMQNANKTSDTNLALWAGTLSSVAIGPIMNGVLGFAKSCSHTPGQPKLPKKAKGLLTSNVPLVSKLVAGTHLLVALALALIGYGSSQSSSSKNSDSKKQTGLDLIKFGDILLLLSWFVLVVTVTLLFKSRDENRGNKRYLKPILLVLPFLLVRLFYSVLSGFNMTTDPTKKNQFSSVTGEWGLALGMGFAMEVVVVSLFVVFAFVNVGADYSLAAPLNGYQEESVPMHPPSGRQGGYVDMQVDNGRGRWAGTGGGYDGVDNGRGYGH